MHGWKGFTEANVLRDCVVAYLIHEIGAPVPLQAGRINRVEHALQRRLWQRSHEIQRRLLEGPDWLECFFCFSCGPAYTHTTPHIFFMCRCSGNGGAGGTVRKAKKPDRPAPSGSDRDTFSSRRLFRLARRASDRHRRCRPDAA